MDTSVIKYLDIQLNTLKCNSYLTSEGLKFHYPDSSLVFCLNEIGREYLTLTVIDRDDLEVDVLRQFDFDYKQMLKEYGIKVEDFLADFNTGKFVLSSGITAIKI